MHMDISYSSNIRLKTERNNKKLGEGSRNQKKKNVKFEREMMSDIKSKSRCVQHSAELFQVIKLQHFSLT